jgi:hypothetical protein
MLHSESANFSDEQILMCLHIHKFQTKCPVKFVKHLKTKN